MAGPRVNSSGTEFHRKTMVCRWIFCIVRTRTGLEMGKPWRAIPRYETNRAWKLKYVQKRNYKKSYVVVCHYWMTMKVIYLLEKIWKRDVWVFEVYRYLKCIQIWTFLISNIAKHTFVLGLMAFFSLLKSDASTKLISIPIWGAATLEKYLLVPDGTKKWQD